MTRSLSISPRALAPRPQISIDETDSAPLRRAMVGYEQLADQRLTFRGGALRNPATRAPLQTVYLQRGFIAYVDPVAKRFWAQRPGESGVARGPFTLPRGMAGRLASVTQLHLADLFTESQKKQAAKPSLVFQQTRAELATVRGALYDIRPSGHDD